MIKVFWGVWLLLILWFSIILCFYSFRQKNYLKLLLSVLVGGISYYSLQVYSGDYGVKLSDLSIMLICVSCSFIVLFGMMQIYYWQKSHLSEMSVKYAVDALPIGICCYEKKGRVLLKNRTMELLYRKLTNVNNLVCMGYD